MQKTPLPLQGAFYGNANPARREKSIPLIFRFGLGCYTLPLRGDGRNDLSPLKFFPFFLQDFFFAISLKNGARPSLITS
ncbi:MAG: hypothetical protein LBP75_07735 [Planctomycetota bacterium]|jgi:hypothetical protein|nr:hypothetical protein [Planctomycetota bacterium]